MATDRDVAEVFARLRDPFPAHEVEWRVGPTTKAKDKGRALAYLNARACMDRLDDAVGPEWWSDEYRKEGNATFCRLTITVPGGTTIHHEDASDDSDLEAVKGGVSGAFKRACVKFGIGRYLYRLEAAWVPLKPTGNSYVLAGDPPALPQWALPGGSGHPPTPGRRGSPPERPAQAEPSGTSRTSQPAPPSVEYMAWVETVEAAAGDAEKLRNIWKAIMTDRSFGARLSRADAAELQKRMREAAT